ncbi:MAG: substrate-binding domain-containing protein, partial [Planctomycetaceae bacterium]
MVTQFRIGLVLAAFVMAGCGGTGSTPPAPPAGGQLGSAGGQISSAGGPSDGSSSPQTAGKAGARKGTIGYSALTLTNPFFKVIADTMQAEARAQGYELLVLSAERDVKVQADHVQEFIVKGVSAIVLNPCDSASIGPA